MKAITDEKLRDAIDVLCEVSFPHPDQQAAFDTLCNAAHALGILGMRYRRMKERLSLSDAGAHDMIKYLLPLAKGYVHENPGIKSTENIIEDAEAMLLTCVGRF